MVMCKSIFSLSSACDIKDLTIIAAPQATLDPVVELKKPIPTRPGRNFGEGAFHSQPAPPRALHLALGETDPWKAPILPTASPPSTQQAFFQCVTSETPFSLSGSASHSLQSPSSLQCFQLNALKAALPDALKTSGSSPSATLQNASQGSLQGLLKLNAAATASLRGSQKSNQVKASHDVLLEEFYPSSTPGGFKMTSALASPQSAQMVNGGKLSSPGGYQPSAAQAIPKKGLQLQTASSQSNSAPGLSQAAYATPSKTLQTSTSRPFQLNAMKGLPPGSAAEAFFRGAIAQASPQRASASARYQGAGAQGLLQVNTDGYASGSGTCHFEF